MPSVFPLEIEEMIFNLLPEDDEGRSALKTCSLVCQAFLPICRKRIFGSIFLFNNWEGPSCAPHAFKFERLLRETPEIADYIRKLDYTIQPADLASLSIQESLKRISRLEFLTVRPHPGCELDWSNNPIRPALLHLLHLPTLTHFSVNNIKDFVVSDLMPCVNLKYLDIGNYTTMAVAENLNTFPVTLPEYSIQLNEFIAGIRSPTATVLCTARRPDGQPIIDFGSLSKITVDIQLPNEGEASQELFKHCQVLTNVNVTYWDPRNVRPSLADMLRPSMGTLKHIVVNFEVDDIDVDPLFGISSELEDMRTKNIIETVTIKIQMHASFRRDDWGRGLDEVLTAPGWFSLKRVSLVIEIVGYDRSNNELELALRKLPETQFRRLSSSNSVSFDFQLPPY